jgi:hypothetical protein
MDVPNRIQYVAKQLRQGHKVNRITVRNFLGYFGAERRGAVTVEAIQNILGSLGLETEPNFQNAWIDEPIRLRLKANASSEEGGPLSTDTPRGDLENLECDEIVLEGTPSAGMDELEQAEAAPTSTEANALEPSAGGESYDPTFRIGSLPAANKIPVMVGQDDTLAKAVTIMLQYDFSQLPVMQGEREVKGVITWKSICSRLALASIGSQLVRDYREDAIIVEANRTLFDVIPLIAEAGYVLVRHSDRKIKGPVTVSDLSLHLQALTEPFLCLREIELHVRNLIGSKVNSDDLSILAEAPKTARKLQGIAALTFGDYVRLIQNPATWGKLQLQIDKSELTKLLDEVREIRNAVMHFDPDPMGHVELGTLKRAVRFMQDIYQLFPAAR